LQVKFFLQFHNEFDSVQRVGIEIVCKGCILGDSVGIDTELFGHDGNNATTNANGTRTFEDVRVRLNVEKPEKASTPWTRGVAE